MHRWLHMKILIGMCVYISWYALIYISSFVYPEFGSDDALVATHIPYTHILVSNTILQ